MKTIIKIKNFTAILFVVFLSQQTFASNILVTNNNDNGPGSLRQAIYNAADDDIITFSDAFTIYLDSTINLGNKTIIINGQVKDMQVRLNGNYYDADNDTIDDDGIMCRPLTIISTGNYNVTLYNLIIENGNPEYSQADLLQSIKYGGGMYVDLLKGGHLLVQNCIIQNNTLTHTLDIETQTIYLIGGGVYVRYGGEFVNCTIRNNKIISSNNQIITNIMGGGISTQDNSNASFTYCTIVGNAIIDDYSDPNAIQWGGGICLLDNALVSNSIIIGNSISVSPLAFSLGGGIFTKNAELTNCVITENFNYEGIGGGVSNQGTNLQNSIIINNNALEGKNIVIFGMGGLNPNVQYIAISDSTDYIPDYNTIVLHENPFRLAPSAGLDQVWGTDDDIYGDLRLVENSPCINAGNPDTTTFTLPNKDFYNAERILEDTIDIGVAEYVRPATSYYLNGTVNAGDGTITAGMVYVINTDAPFQKIDSCSIQADGSYTFTALLPNSYFLLVVPDDSYSEYASTYFGNVTHLVDAIPIEVNTNIISVDFSLVLGTTSVQQFNDNTIEIYPNPAQEYIRINMEFNTAFVSVINILSETVLKEYYYKGEDLSINQLPVGIYIVQVMFENGEYYYSRIIKE